MTSPAASERKKKNAHLWQRHPDDWYVESECCSDALFALIGHEIKGTVCDPACGRGNILNAAQRAGFQTEGYDIVDRGAGLRHPFLVADFFAGNEVYDNVFSNPPYKHADAFLEQAIERSRGFTALLLNAKWANAGRRSARLQQLPLRYVFAVTPRPSMPPGPVIEAGITPGGGTQDYSWFVTQRGYQGPPQFGWARRTKTR